ncbi:MAG TPA: hypothetical protein VFF73_31785 [Planctomycetota bacterium]|nr:hypothetical protein [Planctomycetota bacterium]
MRHNHTIELVEKLLLDGKVEQATKLLERIRIDFKPGEMQLFDRWIAMAPNNELLFEVRALVENEAGQDESAALDLVRGILVARSGEASSELTVLLMRIGQNFRLPDWARTALEAASARLGRDLEAEKKHLLAAIRMAPEEATLFVALARNQRGSSSDLEIFALRNALELVPDWIEGEVELARAHRGAGDLKSARRVIKGLLERWPDSFLAMVEREAIARADEERSPSGRRRRAA